MDLKYPEINILNSIMDFFRITKDLKGKTIIIRPLLNLYDMNSSILSYKSNFNMLNGRWIYKHICFGIIENELKVFEFSDEVYSKFPAGILYCNSNKALKIHVDTIDSNGYTFLNNKYDIDIDDKYNYSDTNEKRAYILDMFESKNINLSDVLESRKKEMSKFEIKIPSSRGYKVYKLGDIYEHDNKL